MIADTDEIALDLLRTPEAGGRVVRGSLVRGVGFGVSTALGLATAVLLLRHLGVVDFGRYATVMAVLGIVAGITDAGLTAVGSRELSVARTAVERVHLLNNLLVLRVTGAGLGVTIAVGFTAVAGYEGVVIAGTAVGGVGVVLISAQSMLTVPIWVGLRIVSLTAVEVLRNLLTLTGVAVLVLAGAGLLPFFGVQVGVAVVLIPITLLLARIGVRFASGVNRTVIVRLLRETLPLAVAFAMSVIYFRVLVVLVSLLSTDVETGLFGTSFRIFEMLLGLPALILSVALPLLSVAGDEDESRLRSALQSMTEVSLLIAALLVVGIAILADAGIRLVGGDEYVRRCVGPADSGAGADPALPRADLAARADRGQGAARARGRKRPRARARDCARARAHPLRRSRGCGLGRCRRRDRACALPLDRARPDTSGRSAEPVVRLEDRCCRRARCRRRLSAARFARCRRVRGHDRVRGGRRRDPGGAARPLPRPRLQMGRGRRRRRGGEAVTERPRVVVLRGHHANIGELRPWELLVDRFESRSSQRPGRISSSTASRFRGQLHGQEGILLPRGRLGTLSTQLIGDAYLDTEALVRGAAIVHTAELGPWFAAQPAREAKPRIPSGHDGVGDDPVSLDVPHRAGGLEPARPARRDGLFLPTTERARRCLLIEGAAPERIQVVEPGIDVERFAGGSAPAGDGHLVVSPGRLVWRRATTT